MKIFKFSFKCRIIRIFDNGFTAILDENEYIIKFQDKKYRPLFYVGDEILVTIENGSEPGQEYTRQKYMVIYCTLKNYLPNGIQFVNFNEQKHGFFWTYRGFITHKMFEDSDIWEKDTLLRIMIKRV